MMTKTRHVAYPRGPQNAPFWTEICSTWNFKSWLKTIIEYEKIVAILPNYFVKKKCKGFPTTPTKDAILVNFLNIHVETRSTCTRINCCFCMEAAMEWWLNEVLCQMIYLLPPPQQRPRIAPTMKNHYPSNHG